MTPSPPECCNGFLSSLILELKIFRLQTVFDGGTARTGGRQTGPFPVCHLPVSAVSHVRLGTAWHIISFDLVNRVPVLVLEYTRIDEA